jgi:CRP-like cAMP-binding protein
MNMSAALATEGALARCVLFQALDPAARREIAGRARRRKFAAGTPIFRAGDPGTSMMAIAGGTVRISMPTVPGREVVLVDLGPGEVFGEVALLDGRERSADATALTVCDMVELDRRNVLPLLEARPDVCLRLLELLCGRLRISDRRMSDIAFLEIPQRIARMLLARSAGPGGTPSRRKRLALSQTEIAAMVGASRENVNRHLRDWQRRGIVESRSGWIVVLREDGLRALAEWR